MMRVSQVRHLQCPKCSPATTLDWKSFSLSPTKDYVIASRTVRPCSTKQARARIAKQLNRG